MNNCNSFWGNLPGPIPVWNMTSTDFICVDKKTGKELQRVARLKDAQGLVVAPFTPFTAWVKKDLIIDSDDISTNVYELSKSTPTKSKRRLSAGTPVSISISPSGDLWRTKDFHFHIRIDVPGQENTSQHLLDFFSTQPIPSIQSKPSGQIARSNHVRPFKPV
jgi:hypothetical protein